MGLPSTPLGNKARCFYWSKKLGYDGFKLVGRNAQIITTDPIFIGYNIEIGANVTIDNCDSFGCYIGNSVAIAHGTFIRTANHKFDDITKPIMLQGHAAKNLHYKNRNYSVIIEDDVWIGAQCVILSGTHISTGSIIAAGSVVRNFIPPFSIVAGNPSRVILNRKKI
jgi:acetyltransferase-like isoleucine patch superfamily enzyme